jgi:hypothetical protein
MKKLIFIVTVAINGIAFSQSEQETKTVNQIVNTFEAVNDMILTEEKLNQLYADLSELSYHYSVLLTLDKYNEIESNHIYGTTQLIASTDFMKNGIGHAVRIEIDSSGMTTESRLSNSSSRIDILIFYRNENGTMMQTNLHFKMRYGIIMWIYEMTDIPTIEL